MVYHVGYYSGIFLRNLIVSLFCYLDSCSHVYISVTAFKSLKSFLRSCNLRYTIFLRKNPVKVIVITINYDVKKKIEDTKQYLLLMWQSICKRTY